MKVKAYKEDRDWHVLASWWDGWKHPIISPEDVCETGFIAFNEKDMPIVACFLVLTNAVYAYVESFISDPKSGWQEREIGIKYLLDHISNVAFDLDYKRLIIVPEKERLKDKVTNAGFLMNKEKVFLCVKEL